MHDVMIVGIPLLAMFAGILFNRADWKELRAEMKAQNAELRAEMDKKIGSLGAEMDKKIGSLGAEMDRKLGGLEKRVDLLRADMNQRHSETLERFNNLDRAMNEFYHMTGRLDARMEAIEKR